MSRIGTIMFFILAFALLPAIGKTSLEAAAQSSLSNLTIVSPQNRIYNSQFLILNATIDFFMARIESMSYIVDGGIRNYISNCALSNGSTIIHGTLIGIAILPEFAEGQHTVTVYLEGILYFPDESHYNGETEVHFTVDTSQPIITGLSVENKTYNQRDLPLDFTVNEPTAWVGYSLDKEANVTLNGNTTLKFEEGLHSIVVYANDTAGNMGSSEMIYFSIKEPLSVSIVAASVLVAAAILIVLFACFKKRG